MCSTGGAIGAETETAGQGSTAVNTLLGPDWPSPSTTRRHRPHGHGHIWTICAQPPAPVGAAISRAESAIRQHGRQADVTFCDWPSSDAAFWQPVGEPGAAILKAPPRSGAPERWAVGRIA